MMLVGEQPGDSEDRLGHPFVGPAGKLLHSAIERAGISPSDVYITNAVKHFKFIERGKRRIHAKPKAIEIRACKPWLEAEIQVVRPALIVALGATAAQSLLGTGFRLLANRGRVIPAILARPVLATIHPSAILRSPDDQTRRREMNQIRRGSPGRARRLRVLVSYLPTRGYKAGMRNIDERQSGFSVLENGRQLQTAVMVLEPGEESGPPGNDHPSSEQVLFVVEGSVEALFDGTTFEMHAGDSAIVPNGAPHQFANRSNERAVTFNVYAPKAYC